MSKLFKLPGRYIHVPSIYGRFYKQYKHPDDSEEAKGNGNQEHDKVDGEALPELDSPDGSSQSGGEYDSAA